MVGNSLSFFFSHALGANVNVQDREGNSPLHILCQTPGVTELVQYLIEMGANVNARTANFIRYVSRCNRAVFAAFAHCKAVAYGSSGRLVRRGENSRGAWRERAAWHQRWYVLK